MDEKRPPWPVRLYAWTVEASLSPVYSLRLRREMVQLFCDLYREAQRKGGRSAALRISLREALCLLPWR